MKVPMADLHAQYLSIKAEIDKAISEVVETSQFILGKSVTDFEKAFALAHQVKNCIAVGSGTDALHASLWALGVGKGDFVITTPYTFIATVEAITITGAEVLFVDINPDTYTLDPEKFQEIMASNKNKKIKAVIPVHLYGHPADMDQINEIASRYGIAVIEDACQSHLAKYKEKFVGNFGITACFSFYPGKNLGAYGEAGGILTNDENLAQKLRKLRDHGQSEKYKHDFCGHNYRMDGIQGAVLGVKLRYLGRWTARRREIARRYKEHLTGVGDLVMPFEDQNAFHVYHLFVVRTKERSELQNYLSEKGIGTALHYPIPIHFQKAYQYLGHKKGDFPVSEISAEECLSLPIYAEMSDDQVDYVIENIRSFFK